MTIREVRVRVDTGHGRKSPVMVCMIRYPGRGIVPTTLTIPCKLAVTDQFVVV